MIHKKLAIVMSLGSFLVGNSFAKETSAECRSLYSTLVSLQKEAPTGESAKNESAEAFTGFDYQAFFDGDTTVGITKAYKNVWCNNGNAYTNLINKFMTPGHLQWVAYLQNRYGAKGPNTFNRASGYERSPWDNPLLGIHSAVESPISKWQILITRYAFFDGLLNAFDQLTDAEWNAKGEVITQNIARLKSALQQAIINAQKQQEATGTPVSPEEINKWKSRINILITNDAVNANGKIIDNNVINRVMDYNIAVLNLTSPVNKDKVQTILDDLRQQRLNEVKANK